MNETNNQKTLEGIQDLEVAHKKHKMTTRSGIAAYKLRNPYLDILLVTLSTIEAIPNFKPDGDSKKERGS